MMVMQFPYVLYSKLVKHYYHNVWYFPFIIVTHYVGYLLCFPPFFRTTHINTDPDSLSCHTVLFYYAVLHSTKIVPTSKLHPCLLVNSYKFPVANTTILLNLPITVLTLTNIWSIRAGTQYLPQQQDVST